MNTKKYIANVMKSLRKSVTQAKASNANVTKQLAKATRIFNKSGSKKRGSR